MHAIWAGAKRLTFYPFAVALAFIGLNSGVNLILNPGRSPVHQLLRPWDVITAGLYALGGLLILIGIAFRRSDIEASGCVVFGGGALINAVVWTWIVGWSAWNTIMILLVFAGAALTRAQHIAAGRVLLLVQTEDRGLPHVVGPE
jgi:hypothetical protein